MYKFMTIVSLLVSMSAFSSTKSRFPQSNVFSIPAETFEDLRVSEEDLRLVDGAYEIIDECSELLVANDRLDPLACGVREVADILRVRLRFKIKKNKLEKLKESDDLHQEEIRKELKMLSAHVEFFGEQAELFKERLRN